MRTQENAFFKAKVTSINHIFCAKKDVPHQFLIGLFGAQILPAKLQEYKTLFSLLTRWCVLTAFCARLVENRGILM